MKSIFSRPKKLIATLAIIAGLAGIAGVATATFGPDRPTKDWNVDQNGFNSVVFNSFVNVPNGIGDERDFFRGGVVGNNTPWIDPVNDTKNDDTVEAKIYIHNNAKSALNTAPGAPGVAKDVNVKVELPTGIKTSHEAKATISASNASPTSVYDTLGFTGVNGSQFELEYIPGSAKLHSNGSATAIADTLVTTGVNIGDQNGCFEFVREITFRMKIKKPGYQIQKVARIKGEDNDKWRKEVIAKPGDKIEWEIYFQNIGSTVLKNVAVQDVVPIFHTVVPGSIKLYNTLNPSGYVFPNSAIQENGKKVNIGISDYAPGSNAYIYLTTEIQVTPELQCGTQQMANIVYVTPEGLGTLNDNAKVNIVNEKPCGQKTPSYACEAINITKLGGRKIKVDVKTIATPSDLVSVKDFEYNFGDGSEKLTTNKNSVEYTYAKDGTYKVKASISFNVEGTIKTVSCEAVVNVSTTTPPTTPIDGGTKPTVLPNTGPAGVIGMFAAISVFGSILHRLWTVRKVRS